MTAVQRAVEGGRADIASGRHVDAVSTAQRAASLFPTVYITALQEIMCECQLALKRFDAALTTSRGLLSNQQNSASLLLHARALVATGVSRHLGALSPRVFLRL